MMARRILVLNVDRDDDFGVKAGIESPMVGRRENLKAAIALGLTDPEDSDTNSTFAAIKLYDRLIDEGEDHVDIATICGEKRAGLKADRNIAAQLEFVLERSDPDGVYLVTDGAEDESIMPIIRSRVPVDHIEKVVVRQEKNIESTIYMIAKAMKDEKIQHKFLTPLALAFLILGFFNILGLPQLGIGVMLLIVGFYLMILVAHLEEPIRAVLADVGLALKEGRSLYIMFGIFGFAFFFFGLVTFWDAFTRAQVHGEVYDDYLRTVVALNVSLGPFLAAFFMWISGRMLDSWFRKGIAPLRSFPTLIILVGMYPLGSALLASFEAQLDPDVTPDLQEIFILLMVGGVLISFAALIQKYFRDRHTPARRTGAGWRR